MIMKRTVLLALTVCAISSVHADDRKEPGTYPQTDRIHLAAVCHEVKAQFNDAGISCKDAARPPVEAARSEVATPPSTPLSDYNNGGYFGE